MIYAMVPFRAHTYKPASTASTHPASAQVKTSAQVKNGPAASAASSTNTTTTRTSPSTP